MTKQELQTLLKDFGTKGKQVANELYGKLEDEKAQIDANTCRQVRAFWNLISATTFGLGIIVGPYFF